MNFKRKKPSKKAFRYLRHGYWAEGKQKKRDALDKEYKEIAEGLFKPLRGTRVK
ncbi:MAG: hypothetical protein KW793_03195 [Candidatus Doudnabacteria bacterium]|nr:hypothetical protein [Candidatus Doudnabacteria bacterium]